MDINNNTRLSTDCLFFTVSLYFILFYFNICSNESNAANSLDRFGTGLTWIAGRVKIETVIKFLA